MLSTARLFLADSPPPFEIRWRFLLQQLSLWWPWVPLTWLIFRLGEQFPLSRRWARDLLVHLAVCLALGFGMVGFLVGHELLAGMPRERLNRESLGALVFSVGAVQVFLYWLLLGLGRAVAMHQRNQELEARWTTARLDSLKAQLRPHFLFNTLHSVSALVDEDAAAARRVLAQLSDLLRASLQGSDRQEVTLEEEVELVRTYLAIEEVRFSDRLRVSWSIDPDVAEALVPHLFLQPLVENAIRHGIAPMTEAGQIEIRARRNHDALLLEVQDDGRGPGPSPVEGGGIGLRNVRDRLAQLYGSEAFLRLESVAPRGALAAVEIPYRTGER